MKKLLYLFIIPLVLLTGCKKEVAQPDLAYPDIVSTDVAGKEIKLSDYVGHGKYVLLDFWASWCPPCRREMPVLVDLYAQYGGKQFEIVGYSLDKNATDWKNGLSQLGMTWPQMSDLKHWESPGVALYDVRSIPHLVLFDPEGDIIAEGLRAGQMAEKLAELLK